MSNYQLGEIEQVIESNPQLFGGLHASSANHVATLYVAASQQGTPAMSGVLAQINTIEQTPQAIRPQKPSPKNTTQTPITTQPPLWTLILSPVTHSLAELNAITAQIPTKEPWASLAKARLSRWYVDPVSNSVHAGLTQVTPELTSAAQQTFGGLVQLETAARPKLLDRLNDIPPYYGGDRLIQVNGSTVNQCTAGFAAVDNSSGDHGMLTAGHCYPAGTAVSQGYYDPGSGVLIAKPMGIVTWLKNGGGDTDAEFVDAAKVVASDTAGYVWTNNTTALPVFAYETSVSGAPFCADGSYTGENCAGQISQTNVCVTVSDGTNYCHLNYGTSTDGSMLGQPGAIGGPVYDRSSGPLNALGIMTIGNVGSGGNQIYYADIGYIFGISSFALLPS